MKITKSQLKQIVNEELNTLLNEQEYRVQQPGTSPYASDVPEITTGYSTEEAAGMPAGSRAEWRGIYGKGDPRYQVGAGSYPYAATYAPGSQYLGKKGMAYPPSRRFGGSPGFEQLATSPTPQSVAAKHEGPRATSPLRNPSDRMNPRPLSSQEAQERLEQLALLSNEPATFADTFGVQSLLPKYVEQFDTGDTINPYQDDRSALAALGFDQDYPSTVRGESDPREELPVEDPGAHVPFKGPPAPYK